MSGSDPEYILCFVSLFFMTLMVLKIYWLDILYNILNFVLFVIFLMTEVVYFEEYNRDKISLLFILYYFKGDICSQ